MALGITIVFGLPFIEIVVSNKGRELRLKNVLLDTGSAATVLRTDDMRSIGITIQSEDRIRFMSGIGGREAVVEKRVERIDCGEMHANHCLVQLGALEYDFPIDGILGMDYLLGTGAVINCERLTISKGT